MRTSASATIKSNGCELKIIAQCNLNPFHKPMTWSDVSESAETCRHASFKQLASPDNVQKRSYKHAHLSMETELGIAK
eukprot:3090315-Amphidinium_carterae.1